MNHSLGDESLRVLMNHPLGDILLCIFLLSCIVNLIRLNNLLSLWLNELQDLSLIANLMGWAIR